MRRAGWVLIGCLAACGAGEPSVPRLDEVLPALARSGDVVDILGDGLCGQDPADVGADETCAGNLAAFVTVGTASGIPRSDGRIRQWKKTRIELTLPALPAGVTSVIVTVKGRQSNAADFAIYR